MTTRTKAIKKKSRISEDSLLPLPTRIDKALVHLFPDFSRRAIKRYLDVGGVYLNRKRVRIASRLVYSGDELEIVPSTTVPVPDVSLTSLYEDEHIVVINKPPCLPTQATRSQAVSHLTAMVQRQYGRHLRLVHRLDQETSGAIVYAKSQAVAGFLAEQFKAKLVRKIYLALVHGVPNWRVRMHSSYLTAIRGGIGIVHEHRKQSPQARLAVTKFTLLACSQSVSLLKCEPQTGRSHQIRAHLHGLGVPIVGDKKYGDAPPSFAASAERHMLHAFHLAFRHPHERKELVAVQAPLPADFCQQLCQHLQMLNTESVASQVAVLAQVSADSQLQALPPAISVTSSGARNGKLACLSSEAQMSAKRTLVGKATGVRDYMS